MVLFYIIIFTFQRIYRIPFISDGTIWIGNVTITLENVLKFALDSWIIPRSKLAISVEFCFNGGGTVRQPSANAVSGILYLPLTRSVAQMEDLWISALETRLADLVG